MEYQKQLNTIMFGLMLVIVILLVCIWKPDCHAQSPITIQPPVGLPTYAYPNSMSGSYTVVPPVGGPTMVYPSQMPSSPVTVQPPVGLPTYIYGR